MLLSLFYSIAFFLQSVLTPGANKVDGKHVKIIPAKITRLAYMDSIICESSALVKPDPEMDLYYTLNDSGCRPELFAINASGKLLDSMTIPDTKNTDWEELVYYRNALQKPFCNWGHGK